MYKHIHISVYRHTNSCVGAGNSHWVDRRDDNIIMAYPQVLVNLLSSVILFTRLFIIPFISYWISLHCTILAGTIAPKFLQACGNLQKLRLSLPQLLSYRFGVIFIFLVALVIYLFVYDNVVKLALEYATLWNLVTVDAIMTGTFWLMHR